MSRSPLPLVSVVLPTYTTLNVSAMFSMLPDEERGLDLVLRIDNLLDTRYQEITNFPSLRRSVYAGLRTTLGF